jgi:AcrR family transcriptional regulator
MGIDQAADLRFSEETRAALSLVLRRAPEQARSWRRVEAVLGAAEAILEEAGYDELVQNLPALCARAGIPTGTFYTYFENIDVVLECIRLLWAQRIYVLTDEAYAQPCRTWQEAADRVVDSTIEFFSHTATRELWLARKLSRLTREAELRANAYAGAHVRAAVQRLGYTFTGDELDELMLVEIADQLSRFAFGPGHEGPPDPAVVDRAKRATRAYLGTLLILNDELDQSRVSST